MTTIASSADWTTDCLYFWGKVLIGKFAHWCPDWDDLPIDATCEEFQACECPKINEDP